MLRLALAIWFFLGGLALAQVVTVRSGQHDSFARLVLTFPEPAAWDFGRTDDGYGFRARKAGWRYDISTVFDRLPRDKLSAVWVDPDTGVLRLGLGCDCHAIATPFRPGIVVIDILAGAAPDRSPYETALGNAGRPMPPLVSSRTIRPKPRPAGLAPAMETEQAALPSMPIPVKAAPPPLLLPLAFSTPDPRAVDMRDRLLRDLSRSIAAGAVKPVAQLPELKPAAPLPSSADLPLAPDSREPGQLRIRPVGEAPDGTLTATGQACIPDDQLDLATWGDDRDPADQLVKAQAALLGEFDRPDQDRLIALVRLNLHLGFGAEARNLLRLWGRDAPDAATLDSLGVLVDGGTAARAFDGMLACDSAAALWALLSQDGPFSVVDVNRPAVLRAFSALPLGLRQHLGPAASDRFLAAGDAESARAIRDAIARAAGPHGDGLTMIEAKIELAEGQSAEAEAKLDTVVADDGAAAAQALAALIELRIRRGDPPDVAQVLALDSMLAERLTSPDAAVLRHALAKGQAMTGAADRAFEEHARQDPTLYPDLWGLLARHGAGLELASLALDPPGPAVATLPTPVRLEVAKRLRAEGFAEGARRWADGVTTDEADLLLAEVAMDLRDGREVLRRIAGQTGTRADALRARALELLGDLPAALTAWEAAGSTQDVDRVRFLTRQWEGLQTPEDPALNALLEGRAAFRIAPSEAEDAPIAQARALLETAASSRQGVNAVLAARQVPGG